MDGIVRGLNDAQRAAVTSPAAVLQCLAPPGSGKTKTLTSRVAHLIAHNGLTPGNIIVCTFTVKAANEMRARIESLLGKATSTKLKIGTFHSIARRFLSIYGSKVGIDSTFGIADTADSKAIISRIIEKSDYTLSAGVARSRISKLKADGITAEYRLARKQADSKTSAEFDELTKVYEEYENALKISNLLDYDDLLLHCVELLRKHPECVTSIEAVLVDEFQDTNHIQYDLMNLFAQRNKALTVVCDPDQSIYGWRSARMENIKKMQDLYPEIHVINLEENYRSSSCILFAAQELIEQDTSRHQKCLAPTHSAGEPPTLKRLQTSAEEAEWMICEMQRVQALCGGLLKWNDFAVLLRSAVLSRHIEKELTNAGIPYQMVGGKRFYDRVEIKLVLDYLRVLDNSHHNEALARVVNVPSRKIGDKTISKLIQDAYDRKESLWSIIIRIARGQVATPINTSGQAQRGLGTFAGLMLKAKAKLESASETTLSDFIRWFVEKLELRAFLRAKYPTEEDYSTRWSNVQELISQAEESQCSNAFANEPEPQDIFQQEQEQALPCSRAEELQLFLGNISLSIDTRQQQSESDQMERGCVTLSTMHAAKGLEWPVVFIPSAYKGSIPHSRAEDWDEERRLLYVAMTRAQCLLYISCPKEDPRQGEFQLSPFVETESLQQRLAKRGHSITHDLVREMAKILGRQDLTVDITGGRARITNLADDLFPRGTVWAGRNDIRGDNGKHEVTGDLGVNDTRFKRIRQDDYEYSRACKRQEGWRPVRGITTSMQQRHTIATAAYSSFVSAKTLPQAEKENHAPVSHQPCEPGRPKEDGKKDARRGQMSISQFCSTRSTPPSGPEDRPTRAKTAEHTEIHWKQIPPAASPSLDSTTGIDGARAAHGRASTSSAFRPPAMNSAPSTGRKTLGIRRSFTSAWNDRLSREAK
ncbi:MAG: hypothetical protein Q9162_001966 [Coniocarpon cinnabarinum]